MYVKSVVLVNALYVSKTLQSSSGYSNTKELVYSLTWSDQTKFYEKSESVVTADLFLRDDAEGTTEHYSHSDRFGPTWFLLPYVTGQTSPECFWHNGRALLRST